MSNGTPQVSSQDSGQQIDRLADENALLRASLSDARARLDELEQLADGDMLTSLSNRRAFLKELKRVVGQAGRHGTPAAMLYIDLKGLKAINERHGRLAGDAALIHVARSLLGLIRSTDMLARIGGDMFALILDHLDHNSAIETGDRLARCIAASPVDLGGTEISVEAFIGVTSILPGDSVDEVMARADQNMARARTGF
ncbi:GGDEF domain-containing protein [Sphingosinicella rhizophila]|uniref:GGDEF domain-containing protein n=1 Tax=Sphingosinicella rhizophila TaxID=3050082 RepID=A0ABU3QC09_9SPHN|nr:GGDEF domain-containing protein [Sphingosinicella sp. GR2756]MDT9600937.1 GGDEF domain-containing protein [Sphingosinicella sp. GR2756]